MFEAYGGMRAWRPCDVPVEVLVNLTVLWPPTRMRWGTGTPVWMRSVGVPVGETVPGVLTGWLATCAGDWLGQCVFSVPVDGRPMELHTWVPSAAIRPRPTR